MSSKGIRGASWWVTHSISASAGSGEGGGERGESERERATEEEKSWAEAGKRRLSLGPSCLRVPSLKPPSHSFLLCTGDPCRGPPSCVPSQPPGSPGRLLSRDQFHSGGSGCCWTDALTCRGISAAEGRRVWSPCRLWGGTCLWLPQSPALRPLATQASGPVRRGSARGSGPEAP